MQWEIWREPSRYDSDDALEWTLIMASNRLSYPDYPAHTKSLVGRRARLIHFFWEPDEDKAREVYQWWLDGRYRLGRRRE